MREAQGRVRRALISVSDKAGAVEFARGLHELGVELISTGGTARELAAAGLPVRQVSELTGFPEILDGRVKTLTPQIHAGILARRDDRGHMGELRRLGIGTIDLVAVNLYPFRATVARPGVKLEEAVENIDIGGPALIRAAAKNYRDVVVVTDPGRYPEVLLHLRHGDVPEGTRYLLAAEAFHHTAAYDALIAGWLARRAGRGPLDLPERLVLCFEKAQGLRYGENPHQRAALYADPLDALFPAGPNLVGARQLQGKELSYNNIGDAQAALGLAAEFGPPAAVVVKHANPCGVALGEDLATAFARARDADPVSIFGGIIAGNRPVDGQTALLMKPIRLDIVVAPGFCPEALAILGKKRDLRLLEVAVEEWLPPAPRGEDYELRRVAGGLLLQEADRARPEPAGWRVVTARAPTPEQTVDLAFAWTVVKHVKSNAIVVAKDGRTLGVGAGQMNRVTSVRLALGQAGGATAGAEGTPAPGAAAAFSGAVLASDAFFPFPDSIEEAARAGIAAIAQPGGSVRDAEVIAAADAAGIAMVFTGIRHFRH